MREAEGEAAPAHHARRPMNAFLIFCKRHRSVVRDKYPNLENRSITKILGEWWANLDKEDKACYTGLAKQYKDAFFNANPDFKWYKLPAPPLRSLAARPRDAYDKAPDGQDVPHCEDTEPELEKTNNNSTKVDFNKKPNDVYENDPKPLSMFTPGKLADEAHMGGLSSLLENKTEAQSINPYYSPPSCKINTISSPIENRSHAPRKYGDDSIRELQNALSETTRVFEDYDETKGRIYRFGPQNDDFTNQDVIDQIVNKRYYDEFGYQKHWSDDDKNYKSGRSCKGKRYQEFMAVGGLIVNKRQKRDSDKSPDEGYNATCSWDLASSRSEESSVTDEPKHSNAFNETTFDTEIKNDTEVPETDNNANNENKTFKAADFDLDAKIRALPSLSLEEFQQRKRDNKRKKKNVNLKVKRPEPRPIVNSVPMPFMLDQRREMAESWRVKIIGSQKRKPKKISITRLEINSLVSSVDLSEAHKISPEIKFATEAPCTVVQSMGMCKQPPTDDLLALATLAEVASNTSKIVDSFHLASLSANTGDDTASKV